MAASNKRRKQLDAVSGYLLLGMAERALTELNRIENTQAVVGEFNALKGEALRQTEDYESALVAYSRALVEEPTSVDLLMGMAWCYKRIGLVEQAIVATEQAYRVSPKEPILMYNLACYYAINGDKAQALSRLGRAFRMDGTLRKLVANEPDFDSLRDDPEFQLIVDVAGEAD
ncbi:MAG: tetratricopeptide repeat protein [Planctomycetaceae bacterium]